MQRVEVLIMQSTRHCDMICCPIQKLKITSRDFFEPVESSEFWAFIKPKFAHYHERRDFLRTEFEIVLALLDNQLQNPTDETVSSILFKVDSEHVQEVWRKALERRASDPDGAITSARTLLETVCKHILDNEQIEYDEKADLPKLYTLAASQLNLAPSQHTEKVFKQILGGCQAVVEGLGALRNRLSDAHGKGKAGVRPDQEHAQLAVNLADAVATFLISTWEKK
jgi:hypothetical protein